MKDLLDIEGASGALYRFRLHDTNRELPATAGNYLIVRREEGALQVIGCGEAQSLMSARPLWAEAVAEHGAEQLYLRLNVARAHRVGEHEDIVAKHRPQLVKNEG
ncbi:MULTISPECIES: hypothetical protein [Phenylobacterium]|uniref:Uncharacterized protein n=1 Tax=Phenylobacterium koreense TaxID=266125 RepID=A0ABV2EDU3_9CAUL